MHSSRVCARPCVKPLTAGAQTPSVDARPGCPRRGQDPTAPAFVRAASAVASAEYRAFPGCQVGMKAVGDHPETHIVVAVAGRVPVTIGAAHVIIVVDERAATHHTTCQSVPAKLVGQFAPTARAIAYLRVCFCQPPKSFPISTVMRLACWYCPGVSQCQPCARRR